MKESGAHSVKMEGGKEIKDSIKRILNAGIPVMGHLGLTRITSYNVCYTKLLRFYIPEGKVVAAYDSDGKILRTIEKFKDIDLPSDVISSLEQLV